MSVTREPYNAGQDRPESKQTEAEHEWNNEGGQQPPPGGSGQPEPAEAAGSVDEYNTRRLGSGEFEVYRLVGELEMHYCTCDNPDAAVLIARALNLAGGTDGRIVETIAYVDGSIFLVVKGDQAELAYNAVRHTLINGPW